MAGPTGAVTLSRISDLQHQWRQFGLGTTEWPHLAENEVFDQLARKVRVLCWVMTAPGTHKTKVPT
jgi:hypothetical protein